MDYKKGWKVFFKDHKIDEILEKIGNEYYPKKEDIFKIFKKLDPKEIKIVILGQDCYHGPGQANGMAFSVPLDCKIPPSLLNIFKEIKREYSDIVHQNGDLTKWVDQGVFLLNCALTVKPGLPGSHMDYWKHFTDSVIKFLNEKCENIVFLLWGKFAHSKLNLIDQEKNVVFLSAHPSPLASGNKSMPFIGNNHFKLANDYLVSKKINPIDWCI